MMKSSSEGFVRGSKLFRIRKLSWIACCTLFLLSSQVFAAPIRIGEINPLTGKLAEHGLAIHDGIEYAVSEVNSRGGISGRQVELFSRDDQSQPEVAINQAQDLLYRVQVVGLVGGYVDTLVGPISEIAARHHIPYVASASLQRSLTLERSNPYFFRVSHLEGVVRPLCEFVRETLHPKNAAILFSATPGSTEFAEEVRACLEKAGIEIPIFEKFRPGSPDFSSFLLKVRGAKVDLLISGGFFPDHLILIRQLQEQRVPLKAYVGPWGIAYPSFVDEMGKASERLFGMCAWNPGITLPGTEAQSTEFEQGFLRQYRRAPNTTTMHGYTSARVLLSAVENTLKKGRELSGEAIREELRSLDMVLPMEHLVFDDKGDPKEYRQVIVQIQSGKFVPVFPADRATGRLIYPMDAGSSVP